jgi:type IV pilus assembly protein PilB
MKNQELLTQYLNKNYITQTELDVALKISSTSHHNVDDILLACGFVTSQEVAKVRSQRLDTEYIDLTQFTPHHEALSLIPREKAIELSILPLMIQNEKLFISIDERADYKHKAYLERVSQKSVRFIISSKKEILNHLMTHEYYTKDDAIRDKINILKAQSHENTNIIDLVDLLIEDAIEDSVSDIHISPEKDVLNVFFRIDGVLVHYHSLPKIFHQQIVSRIKILSSLDISQTSLPQDGQIEYEYLHANFRLRVSTIGTTYGENVVMRLLKNSVSDLTVETLGLTDENQKLLSKLFKQPNGLILVTGPTGSGKTTTLYSALKEINSLSKNILTVEDPVEYHIPFIKQTQINTKAGYTFNSAIRAFMRQDPDVYLLVR